VLPPPVRVTQTEQGRYRLANVPPGRYLITYLRVREVPPLGTTQVAVTWNGGGNVELKAP